MIRLPDLHSMQLRCGRILSYALYGDACGTPVYYMHGFYGSRIEAMLAAAAAGKCGLQLIAVDRPGVGRSSFEPVISLESWAAIIGELADQLGHKEFSILGVSGGGPFALSCAHFLSDRVQNITLCGSLAPLDNQTFIRKLPLRYRAAVWLQQHFKPGLYWLNKRLYFGARHDPSRLLRKLARHLADCDKKILAERATRDIMIASLAEAANQNPLYGAQELTIFGAPWGFDLKDIPMPVTLWHGGQDEMVPVAMAYQLADKLTRSCLHIIPDAGHFSLPVLHAEKILQGLKLKRNNTP